MILFFLIFFGLHSLVNFYIGLRGFQALEAAPQLRIWFVLFMVLMVVAYPLGRMWEKSWYHPLPITLHWIGAFWFAVMLYATLTLVVIDLARVINHFWPFFHTLSENYIILKGYAFLGVTILILAVVGFGHYNAWHPQTTKMDIVINKSASPIKSLRIVAVSDVHLGTIIGPRKTEQLVQSINALKPDLVLFAGDVVDEDVKPVIKQNLGECLQRIEAPMGVYACTGNHEYIGGGDPSIHYLEQNGITVLRDSVALINDAFYLVGREDLQKKFSTHENRASLEDLLKGLDFSKPIIMLDHQPYALNEVVEAGVDLQISGHTHHGQLWPLGYVTQKIFEVSRGYKKKGDAHFYVSTGYGTWGPPVRTGNRPEIVLFQLKFNP